MLTPYGAEKEVEHFAYTHNDFEKLRPLMYLLSIQVDYNNKSLKELYDEAKFYDTITGSNNGRR